MDWAVEHFPERDYSFESYVDRMDEKLGIIVMILRNEIRFEKYEFHGGKVPNVRTYF